MADAGLSLRLKARAPIALDIALDCAPGELLAIIGPSGAGKSTTLRAIAGLHHPESGSVICDGQAWLDTSRALDLPAHRRRAWRPHLGGLRAGGGGLLPSHGARLERAELAPDVAPERGERGFLTKGTSAPYVPFNAGRESGTALPEWNVQPTGDVQGQSHFNEMRCLNPFQRVTLNQGNVQTPI